jgi:anti-sigma factor (TIGR02949 family)
VQPDFRTPLTCQEAIELLVDYLDQTLGERLLAELERHLADCAPCRAYLRTYRRTRDLTARAAPADMPPELRARLRDFLRQRVLRGEV